jgi:uncharacterized SAM-binding protein YcdF (DUF218 family)
MTARRALVVLAVLVALVGLGVLAHRPILRAGGQLLVVDQPREASDAIVVVAGATPSREETAAALYREGLAPRIVVSRQIVPDRVQRMLDLGIRRHDFQGESVLALEKFGVPRDAIITIDRSVEITETELREVADVARRHGWQRLLLVTTWSHSRRVHVIWRREAGEAIEARLVTVPDVCAAPEDWWRRRRCSEGILHEYLGLLALYLRLSSLMR